MRLVTLVIAAIFVVLVSCDSGSDSGPGADAPGGAAVDAPAGGTPDAPVSGGPDANPGGTDGGPGGACAEPGATGNALGVGEYCTPGGGECSDNSQATLCTVDFEADAPPFCTMLCFSMDACGEAATCESMGGSGPMGCTPACLTMP